MQSDFAIIGAMKTALVVDDLLESRSWLGQALETAFEGIAIHAAGSLAEARTYLAQSPPPDLALIDIGLPDGSGIELISELSRAKAETLCLVASIFDDNKHLFPALRAGAQGYLLKDQPMAQIVDLLKGIAEGRPPISPSIARKMLAYFQPSPQPDHCPLTEREKEVLRCIAKGLTLPETAQLLALSQHTVSGYVKDIYRKLNISSRAEAALTAHGLGLI